MGDTATTFNGSDYKEVYDLDVGSSSFIVAIHNEGHGADILPREAVDADVEPWDNYLEQAENALQGVVENAAGAVLVGSQKLLGDPGLRAATAGVNYFDPSYTDIDEIQTALGNTIALLDEVGGMEAFEAKANLENARTELQEAVETNPAYAVLNAVYTTLEEMGFSETDLDAAFTADIDVNNVPDTVPSVNSEITAPTQKFP